MTKQRSWQIKMVSQGRCQICGKPTPTKKSYCSIHNLYHKNFYRKKHGISLDLPDQRGKKQMSYTPKAQEYIDSVDGAAHQSAVEIIGKLEVENKALKESDELRASLLVKFQEENKALKENLDKFIEILQ